MKISIFQEELIKRKPDPPPTVKKLTFTQKTFLWPQSSRKAVSEEQTDRSQHVEDKKRPRKQFKCHE